MPLLLAFHVKYKLPAFIFANRFFLKRSSMVVRLPVETTLLVTNLANTKR